MHISTSGKDLVAIIAYKGCRVQNENAKNRKETRERI